jgi:hypothetical protein
MRGYLMSDFYQFGKNVRDVLRGILDANEASSAVSDFASWRSSCACAKPSVGEVLGYLSPAQHTIWVCRGSEQRVRKSFGATEIRRSRWRASVQVAGHELQDEYEVHVVDRIDPESVGKEPKPGDKRRVKNYDCTGIVKASDTGCKNTEKGDSTQQIRYDFKTCEKKDDKECSQTFSEVGKTLIWPGKDCQGDPDTISYIYMWTCS